jgi:predicted RND superfamily exporter protein
MAAIIVQPEYGVHQDIQYKLLDEITAIIDTLDEQGEVFSLVGLPVVKQQINRSLMSDMAILAPIVGLLIIIVLFFSFRRFAGIVLPLFGLILSAAITLGIMAVFDITFTMATMLVPVLLLIVGSAYAIHVMSHFYEEIAHINRPVDAVQTRKIIRDVSHRNRLPIIMAGATTAAGFIAQFTSPLGPFRTFGLLSAIGVILSQLSSLYLLPALLRITYRNGIDPIKIHAERDQLREVKGHPVFMFFERIALRGRILLIILTLVIALGTILLVPSIETGTNMLGFFNPSSRLVRDTDRFNDSMNGSGILTFMIDGKEPAAILDPAFLVTLDQFAQQMETHEAVGTVQTVTPYLKRMNFIMHQDTEPYATKETAEVDFDFFGGSFGATDTIEAQENSVSENVQITWDPATYAEIPTDPAKYGKENKEELKNLLSQYLLLYAGNLDTFINDELEPSATLITIQLRKTNTETLRATIGEAQQYWEQALPEGWEISIGGGEAISLALTDLVTKSQIYSLIGALVIVWILVSLIFRSPLAGIIGLIPVLFALAGIFGFMAILNIQLDVITSLLAALAIGIGVDYAIHFMSACQRQACSSKTSQGGLRMVMHTTGRAIVINAASVTIGFSGLIFSRFIPIQQMGILFCVSMVFAGLSSLTVLPMILHTTNPAFLTKKRRNLK